METKLDGPVRRVIYLLKHTGYIIKSTKAIAYGMQLTLGVPDIIPQVSCILRVFHGKKGVTLDVSPVKSSTIQSSLVSILQDTGYRIRGIVAASVDASEQTSEQTAYATTPLIGVDESGKGDFFGPLVIAAVYTKPDQDLTGIIDSKQIPDAKIAAKAAFIRNNCEIACLVLDPPLYNRAYEKIKNLNTLLAHGHAKVIKDLTEKTGCTQVLSDQFARPEVLLKACHDRQVPTTVRIHQTHRAERIPAVAAASIIARDSFLNELAALSAAYTLPFPKGCTAVTSVYSRFIDRYGKQSLGQVAKTHFKLKTLTL